MGRFRFPLNDTAEESRAESRDGRVACCGRGMGFIRSRGRRPRAERPTEPAESPSTLGFGSSGFQCLQQPLDQPRQGFVCGLADRSEASGDARLLGGHDNLQSTAPFAGSSAALSFRHGAQECLGATDDRLQDPDRSPISSSSRRPVLKTSSASCRARLTISNAWDRARTSVSLASVLGAPAQPPGRCHGRSQMSDALRLLRRRRPLPAGEPHRPKIPQLRAGAGEKRSSG